MEEDIASLLEQIQPDESQKFPNLSSLLLTWKYLPALPPNPRNIRLYYRFLKKRNLENPKASLCIVHGFAEHSGRLINAAVHFALLDYEVHMIDLRHLGYSGGARAGHNLFELQSDINLLLQQANPNLPCFLWGHSMGGLLITTILINNPKLAIAGAILTSPFYKSPNASVGKLKEFFMNLAAPLIKQNVFNSFICPSSVTRDDISLRTMFEDTKMVPFLGSCMALSMLKHLNPIIPNSKKLIHPAVFFHGNKDTLTCCEATKKVYENCGSKDKTMVVLEGEYHQPHHDSNRDSFLKKASDWVEARYKGEIKLGIIQRIKIGPPGMEKKSKIFKFLIIIAILVYLGIAWKIKIPNMMALILKLNSIGLRLFWPLALIFKQVSI